jgi:hypothetical protein
MCRQAPFVIDGGGEDCVDKLANSRNPTRLEKEEIVRYISDLTDEDFPCDVSR